MAFQIPEHHEEAVKTLLHLEAGQRDAIVGALEKAPVVASKADLVSHLCDSVPMGNCAEVVQDILDALLSLEYGRNVLGRSSHDFATDLCQAAKGQQLAPQDLQWERLEDQLSRIFSCHRSVGRLSKALAIVEEEERIFMDSRIISDLRPVFEDDPSAAPVCTLVTHHLKIDYLEKGGSLEFYVAMDRRDLERLKCVVDRAIRKERTLRQLAERMDMPVVSPTDEE